LQGSVRREAVAGKRSQARKEARHGGIALACRRLSCHRLTCGCFSAQAALQHFQGSVRREAFAGKHSQGSIRKEAFARKHSQGSVRRPEGRHDADACASGLPEAFLPLAFLRMLPCRRLPVIHFSGERAQGSIRREAFAGKRSQARKEARHGGIALACRRLSCHWLPCGCFSAQADHLSLLHFFVLACRRHHAGCHLIP
jgi:hypothetical protein